MKKFVYYQKLFDGCWSLRTASEEPPKSMPEGSRPNITRAIELPPCDHYRTLGELEILYPLSTFLEGTNA